MVDLLKFIPPIKHNYYKNLRTNRYDGTSNTADEEDIIADESITNNNILQENIYFAELPKIFQKM